MSTLTSYSPSNTTDCKPDYTAADTTLLTAYDDWNVNLDAEGDSSEYNDSIDKIMTIAAYVEAKNYSVTASDYDGKFTGVTLTAPTETVQNLNGKPLFKVFNITLTGADVPYVISIVKDFDFETYINKGLDHADTMRGLQFFTDNTDQFTTTNGYTTVGNVMIAGGLNCIPAMALLKKLGLDKLSAVFINIPSVFLTETTGDITSKKITEYKNLSYNFKLPDKLFTDPATSYPLHAFGYALNSKTYSRKLIRYETTPTCINEYSSLYSLVYNTLTDNIYTDCFMDLNYILPTSVTIPTDLTNESAYKNARDTIIAIRHDLADTVFPNFLSKYYSDADNLGACLTGTTGNELLFIGVTDDFHEESPVEDQTQFTNITDNGVTYQLLTECNKSFTTVLGSMETGLANSFSMATFNSPCFIYCFGSYVFSLLHDIKATFTALDFTTNVTLLVEALPAVTKGFFIENANFTTVYGIPADKVLVQNIWQDTLVNKKTVYDGNLDDITVNKLHDKEITGTLEENPSCVHSVYGYNTLFASP